MVEQVMSECGRLDILVNNAAYQMTHKNIEEFSSEEFEHTFRTNIFAMFYLAKAALPRMKPGSVIINTASVQAY
jgi:NAD(P)-dependent dehydrogenase (short-subunit alcohol dehydrogenase family)